MRHALSLAPQLATANATYALVQGEQSTEAEASLRKAVALDPNYSEAWNWLGNSLAGQSRRAEAKAAYEHAVAIDPLLDPAVGNLAAIEIELDDQAALGRLVQTITTAGASPQRITSLKVEQAFALGDFSRSIELLRTHPMEGGGHPNPALWDGWFETLTALGYFDKLHGITGCPEWYAPLLSGKALPPTTIENKPAYSEEFWTSMFFSAPASRAMVQLGHSRDLVQIFVQDSAMPMTFITRPGPSTDARRASAQPRDRTPAGRIAARGLLPALGYVDEARAGAGTNNPDGNDCASGAGAGCPGRPEIGRWGSST